MVLLTVGLVDLLARSRAITTTMMMSGIPVKEMVGADSEGKIPLIRTRRSAYATADQKSSFRVFKSRCAVASGVLRQRAQDSHEPCRHQHP